MSTPMTSPHFDLNNMLKLQQNYSVDLTKIPIDAATNSSNNNAVSNINNQLNSLYNNITSSQAASQAVLFKQKIVNDILDTESQRLKAKKANIDTAISGQKRMIVLNDNYQKRYGAYTKMAIAFVVGIIAYVFIDKLKVLLPFIPDFVYYILTIVVLGSIAIYIYVLYMDILKRDKMNYDEYTLAPPSTPATHISADGTISGSGGAGSGAAGTPGSASNYENCIGPQCCGVDQNGKPIPYSETKGCYISAVVA
jgi:hypothetical protein